MKITKNQLKRIIKEEKRKLLKEGAYVHDIFRQAATALEMRDGSKLEDLAREVDGLMMNERERSSFSLALYAMSEAAYELESWEQE
tara:strand:- start:1404 stop:1661 length:258 start_codon:yes stop_codon:yes gene_type:complete